MSYRPTPISPPACKRAHVLLGTLVRLDVEGVASSCVDEAFTLARRLQGVFSPFDPASCVSRFRRGESFDPPREFVEALQLARRVETESAGAFRCRDMAGALDLTGLAKGFIVDRMVAWLESAGGRGSVNAGGDLRYFGTAAPYRVHLRAACGVRALDSYFPAVATSRMSEALNNADSSTRYSSAPRLGLTVDHSVTVLAHEAVVADALTKVALFGSPGVLAHCCSQFNARAVILDAEGSLSEAI